MYKLLKISSGSRMNVPETEIIPVRTSKTLEPGDIYFISDGTLQQNIPATQNRVAFMVTEKVPVTSMSLKHVKGFYVTEDMLFETTYYGGAPYDFVENSVVNMDYFYGSSGCLTTMGEDALVTDISRVYEGIIRVKLILNTQPQSN